MSAFNELERYQKIFIISQLGNIAFLAVAGLGVWFIEFLRPSFFNYPYFSWNINWGDVFLFWPLFLYGFVMAALSCLAIFKSNQKNEIFALGVVISVLAGIWEELGFRAVFICYAMIGLLFLNFFLSFGAGLVGVIPGIIIIGLGIYFFYESKDVAAAVLVGGGLFLGWMGLSWGIGTDPVYWFYRVAVVPLINFVTVGQFESVFYGGHDPFFIFGAIVANAWFREGHKYQGIAGVINSWVFGFVMLYATVTYGLLIAVILHVVYDLEFNFVQYGCRRFIQ